MTRLSLALVFALAALLITVPDHPALAGKREDAAKWTAQLKTGTVPQKVEAVQELAKLGQIQKSFIKEAEPLIVKLLDDKDATLRAASARAVGMIDPDVKAVLPKLRKLLADDPSEPVRIAAAAGIGALGESGRPALPDLRKVMSDTEKESKLYRAAMQATRSVRPKK